MTTAQDSVRVLVVDDDPAVLRMVKSMLEHAGFNVATARNGADALAVVQAHPGVIDIVLSDVQMPGIDGTELAEKLGQIAKDLPVMLMSGFTRAISPARPFIRKPFGPAALVAFIENTLSRSRKGAHSQIADEPEPPMARCA